MLESTLLIFCSYLLGAIPSAYIVARYKGGIDIRKYGSGNAGAANVMIHIGIRTGYILGAFDCLIKGSMPVLIGRLLDLPIAVQTYAGLAAILAHNWSPFLKLTGGRGVATAMGIVIGFFLWQEALILTLVLGIVGRLIYKDTGFWTLVAMVGLTILTLGFQRPSEIVAMTIGIGFILITKRLTANWERPEKHSPIITVLLNRLIWDRDVTTKTQWTERNWRD